MFLQNRYFRILHAFKDSFEIDTPPPSVLHALWTRRRWFEVFGHKGQGPGHVEKRDQTHRSCWGQRAAGSSLEPSPARYEGLDGQQNTQRGSLNIIIPKKTVQVNGVYIQQTRDVDLACQSHISFAHSTEQSAVVDHPSDAVVYNQFSQIFVVQHISVYKWA